jgi:hypothetical protein
VISPIVQHWTTRSEPVRVVVDVEGLGGLDGVAVLLEEGQEQVGDLHRRVALPTTADHQGPPSGR